jgi:two-component system response regulator YesN
VKRHLSEEIIHEYRIVLSCIDKARVDELHWEDDLFKYAFCNLTSELLLDELDFVHTFSYLQNDTFYNITIVDTNIEAKDIIFRCRRLIQACNDYLQCRATCYVSEENPVDNIASIREELEKQDRNNILSRGKVVMQNETPEATTSEQYVLDAVLFNKLFTEGEKVKIVNTLKKELELLTSEKRLDSSTLHSIRQDFMQLVYALLYKNEIQAHKLFSDNSSKKLFQSSENTVLDLMKWAAFVTNKTIDYIAEVQRSESVIDKAKRFIQQNYTHNVTREDIALNVFLTPDYLSKMFKAQTGMYIKDYINELRIEKAKELLINSDASISTITSDTGFENFSYFSTVFKKTTGESPYAFRKHHKK